MNNIKDRQVLQSCVDQSSQQFDFFGYKLTNDISLNFNSPTDIADPTMQVAYMEFLIREKVMFRESIRVLNKGRVDELVLGLQQHLISNKCQEMKSDEQLPDNLVFQVCEDINQVVRLMLTDMRKLYTNKAK